MLVPPDIVFVHHFLGVVVLLTPDCFSSICSGRIDKKLLLGYMDPPSVSQMLEHYYETTLTDIQKSRIDSAICGTPKRPQLKLTPAQVEQMTAEHDDVEDMLEALEIKGALRLGPYLTQPTHKSMVAFDM